MLSLVLKRLLLAAPSLFGVVVVTFLLTRALPGDPAAYFAGPAATKEAIEQVRVKLGLDKSLPEQFVAYVWDLAHGDMGSALTTGQPVASEIRARLPASAELTLLALILAMSIRGAARHLRCHQPQLAHRSRLPCRSDCGRFAAGVLHRPDPGLRLLLPAGWSPAPLGRLDVFYSEPAKVHRAST
jgi:peptide/nickel transport system permease protein